MGLKSQRALAKRRHPVVRQAEEFFKEAADIEWTDYSSTPGKEPSRKEMEELVKAAYRTWDKMTQSHSCMILLTECYQKDPLALIQLGAAICLDKPIVLLAPKDLLIPGNIRSMASAIEQVDMDDERAVQAAMVRLMKKVKGH